MIDEKFTYSVIQAAYEVHNTLGHGFLEKIYERALVIECQRIGLKVVCQKGLPVFYKGNQIGDYYADMIIEDKVLLELKAARSIDLSHQAQLLHYLKATGMKVGLVLNFGSLKLGIKRLVR